MPIPGRVGDYRTDGSGPQLVAVGGVTVVLHGPVIETRPVPYIIRIPSRTGVLTSLRKNSKHSFLVLGIRADLAAVEQRGVY